MNKIQEEILAKCNEKGSFEGDVVWELNKESLSLFLKLYIKSKLHHQSFDTKFNSIQSLLQDPDKTYKLFIHDDGDSENDIEDLNIIDLYINFLSRQSLRIVYLLNTDTIEDIEIECKKIIDDANHDSNVTIVAEKHESNFYGCVK